METVINLEETNSNEPNVMDLNKSGANRQFYDNVNPGDITTTFEENVLKPETYTFPSPPIAKFAAKRKAPMATTRSKYPRNTRSASKQSWHKNWQYWKAY